MSDLRERVVEWMRDHGRGYRAAARHFELNVDQVKHWARTARQAGVLPPVEQATPSPSPAATPALPGRLEPTELTDDDLAVIGTVEFYEAMVRRLALQVVLAESQRATNSLAALMKQLSSARDALDQARDRQRATEQAGRSVSPAEAAEKLLILVEQLPLPFLERLYQRVLDALGGPPLRLVEDLEDEVEAS